MADKLRCDRCGRRAERGTSQGERCEMVTVDTRYYHDGPRFVVCQGTFQPDSEMVKN